MVQNGAGGSGRFGDVGAQAERGPREAELTENAPFWFSTLIEHKIRVFNETKIS